MSLCNKIKKTTQAHCQNPIKRHRPGGKIPAFTMQQNKNSCKSEKAFKLDSKALQRTVLPPDRFPFSLCSIETMG